VLEILDFQIAVFVRYEKCLVVSSKANIMHEVAE